MKRILALIMALVMCLSMFACSNDEKETNTREEIKTTVEEIKTTVEEIKTTVEEKKSLTLDDIKEMTILELARLELEDVNHFSAAELKMATKIFNEKREAVTEEELREYVNEFYLKEQPELATLADNVMKLFAASKELNENANVSEETYNNIKALERVDLSQTYENDKLMQSYAYVNHFQAYLDYGKDTPEGSVFYEISKSCYQHIAAYLITAPIFFTE